jgi:hypothetical protein
MVLMCDGRCRVDPLLASSVVHNLCREDPRGGVQAQLHRALLRRMPL